MNLSFDTVVVGAGLAGCCAALSLAKSEEVLLIDEEAPGSGASGVPIGLVSPLMARRARPVWRMQEAVSAFQQLVEEADAESCFDHTGVLKAARSAEQADEFKDAARKWSEHGEWIPSTEAARNWPFLFSEHGVLRVTSGGIVPMPIFCNALVEASICRGSSFRANSRLFSWKESGEGVTVFLDSGEEIRAKKLILSVGWGFKQFTDLSALRLHPIKGQWIRLVKPAEFPAGVTVSSRSYLASDRESVVVGSSYEHSFSDMNPTEPVIQDLTREAAFLAPSLEGAELLDAGAGVRITVPEIRLPMLGPIPEHKRVWIFTGLGAKGLLMAPLLAQELPQFFAKPSTIPKEISVNLIK